MKLFYVVAALGAAACVPGIIISTISGNDVLFLKCMLGILVPWILVLQVELIQLYWQVQSLQSEAKNMRSDIYNCKRRLD